MRLVGDGDGGGGEGWVGCEVRGKRTVQAEVNLFLSFAAFEDRVGGWVKGGLH